MSSESADTPPREEDPLLGLGDDRVIAGWNFLRTALLIELGVSLALLFALWLDIYPVPAIVIGTLLGAEVGHKLGHGGLPKALPNRSAARATDLDP
jgi:hypothetical protein